MIDAVELVRDVIILVLPVLVSLFARKFLKSQEDVVRLKKVLALAEEAVLFVEDAFPEKKGTEKLKEAIEYLKAVLARAGIQLSDAEAEAKVRAAYQRLQGKALERLIERLAE